MSIIKQKEQRVGIFIDTQNLYHSAKNLYGARVNFGNVLKEVLDGRKLVRAIAYVITSEAGDEKAFFEALTNVGIETKSKNLQIFAGGSKKADWDVGLAVDAISLASKLDAVVIVSGDGDFVPLVNYLRLSHGCQVEAATFGKSASHMLREAVDDFIDLDLEPHKYLMINGRPTPHTAPLRRPARISRPINTNRPNTRPNTRSSSTKTALDEGISMGE